MFWFNTSRRRQQRDLPGNLGALPFMVTYGCPTCRTELTKTPAENFSIKSVIEAVGVQHDTVSAVQTASQGGELDDIPLAELLKHLE